MPINTKLNNKANYVQEYHHVVRIERFTKQIFKKYLQYEFNYKNFQRTSSLLLIIQTI